MAFTIRKANEKDYPRIKALCADEGWTSFARSDFDDALRNSILIVACDDNDAVIGYARALSDGHVTIFLCEILIDKAHRKRGYGKKLIDYVLDLYPTARIDLISDADIFYEKLGFRKIGSGMRLNRVRNS